MGTPANLLYGPPEYIKIGPYGADEAACTDLGFTDAGVQIVNSKSITKRRVDQVAGAVKASIETIDKQLKVTLQEASLENIRLALGLPSSALANGVLSVGANEGKPGDEPAYYTIYLKGPGPAGGTRHIKIQKAYVDGDITYPMGKANANIEITFELVQDTTQPTAKQWYKITDAAGDTTPPTVTTSTPADNATNVSRSANLTVTFSERIQAGYVNDTYFKLIKATDGTAVACTYALSADGLTVTIDPVPTLDASTAYLLVVSKGIRDMMGNQLAADYIVNFTTGT